ncbi:MAG: hypothetical protein ACRECA_01905, partial [Pseudolabrys sp.]
AFRQARIAAAELGVPLRAVVTEEMRLRTASISATEAMERQASRAQSIGARIRQGLGGAIGNLAPFLGPGILRGTVGAIKAGAAFQHETDFALPAAGIGKDEIAWAREQAFALAAKYPIVGATDILKLYRETRSVISGEVNGRQGLTQEQRLEIAARDTQKIFPTIIRAEAALKASGSNVEPGDMQKLIKGFEALGITQDVGRTEKLLDAYVKATQVAGHTIQVDTVLKSVQQMLGTGALLSDRFIKSTFLSLVQEGGSRIGAGLGMMETQFLGETGHKQALQWKKLGFLKDSDLIRTKTGKIQGMKPGHHLLGAELAESDPDFFVWNLLKPALVKAGYTTTKQQIAEVMLLFGQ